MSLIEGHDRTYLAPGIAKHTFESWNEFINYISNAKIDSPGRYMFRGQKSYRLLCPTLYRSLQPDKIDESFSYTDFASEIITRNKNSPILKSAEYQLERFKRSARGVCSLPFGTDATNKSDSISNETNWWALGQHMGLATPLLDWTGSPGVALFFSFSEEKKPADALKETIVLPPNSATYAGYRVIYRLDRGTIESIIDSHGSKICNVYRQPESEFKLQDYPLAFLDPLTHDNNRLVAQRGLFTKAPVVNRRRYLPLVMLELWIASVFSSLGLQNIGLDIIFIKEDNSYKNQQRKECLVYLNSMNINYKTLFPDIYGAAKHSNVALDISDYE